MTRYLIFATLLGLGFATTIAASAGPFWGRHHVDGRQKMEAFMKLPVEKQILVLTTIKQLKGDTNGLREEIRATRQALTETLAAPDFDEAAFNQDVDKLRELMIQLFKTLADTIKGIAPQFTQEERQVLAEILPGWRQGGIEEGK